MADGLPEVGSKATLHLAPDLPPVTHLGGYVTRLHGETNVVYTIDAYHGRDSDGRHVVDCTVTRHWRRPNHPTVSPWDRTEPDGDAEPQTGEYEDNDPQIERDLPPAFRGED